MEMVVAASDRFSNLRRPKGHRSCTVLDLLQQPLGEYWGRCGSRRFLELLANGVNVFTALELEDFVVEQIEPAIDGCIDLVCEAANDGTRIAFPGGSKLD